MSVLATDNFNRADANDLGPNWTGITTLDTIGIFSNAIIITAPNFGIAGQFNNTVVWPNNQYSQIVMGTVSTTSDAGLGPAVRCQTGGNGDLYLCQGNTVETRLYKRVANNFTQLGSDGPAVATNDVLYLEVNGSNLTVKKNGSTIITATDSSISSGSAGLWGGQNNNPTGDNWEGGDLGGGGAAPIQGRTIQAQYTDIEYNSFGLPSIFFSKIKGTTVVNATRLGRSIQSQYTDVEYNPIGLPKLLFQRARGTTVTNATRLAKTFQSKYCDVEYNPIGLPIMFLQRGKGTIVANAITRGYTIKAQFPIDDYLMDGFGYINLSNWGAPSPGQIPNIGLGPRPSLNYNSALMEQIAIDNNPSNFINKLYRTFGGSTPALIRIKGTSTTNPYVEQFFENVNYISHYFIAQHGIIVAPSYIKNFQVLGLQAMLDLLDLYNWPNVFGVFTSSPSQGTIPPPPGISIPPKNGFVGVGVGR